MKAADLTDFHVAQALLPRVQLKFDFEPQEVSEELRPAQQEAAEYCAAAKTLPDFTFGWITGSRSLELAGGTLDDDSTEALYAIFYEGKVELGHGRIGLSQLSNPFSMI